MASRTSKRITSEKAVARGLNLKVEHISSYETLKAQLDSLHEEMQTLVKKSPNDAVNQFKLSLVNSLIRRANTFLNELDIQPPFGDFIEFLDDALPTNSDVLIVVSQYIACLEKFRADNIMQEFDASWYWSIGGKVSGIRTAPPKKI